ncbi:MAG: class F sortase [Jatrophihabitantaceae bacterium]
MSIRTHRARLLGTVGAVLLAAGVIAIVIALRAQQSAPQPPQSAASPVAVVPTTPRSAGTSATAPTPTTRGPILVRSQPIHLSIPTIGVNSDLKQTGLTPAGLIQEPPLSKDSHAYWLSVSPTPGQLGPATIIGHVDSATNGPGVFFRLGALRQRARISVTRADGTVAVFEVERVVEYPKAKFPTKAVYGNTDNAALRLITCGGTFNPSTGSYESNIVAYASLVSTHRA